MRTRPLRRRLTTRVECSSRRERSRTGRAAPVALLGTPGEEEEDGHWRTEREQQGVRQRLGLPPLGSSSSWWVMTWTT
jgi:hypothetical protein